MTNRKSLTAQGSDCPDGFAHHVYDYIQVLVEKHNGTNHRFFVYHPDTKLVIGSLVLRTNLHRRLPHKLSRMPRVHHVIGSVRPGG